MNVELNGYFYFILITVVALYLIDLIANLLNLKALKPELPGEFADVYDAEKYKTSQNYTRDGTKFEFISDTFSLVVFLAFWLLGGFGWLDEIVRGWGFQSEIVRGIIFIVLLYVAQMILGMPFSLYDTFVIEERYGFNKTTMRTYISDLIKSLILSAVIGLPILALLLWIFEFENAWIYAWLFVTCFSLLMTYLAPTYIMPLFNKFQPLEEGELKSEIDKLSTACEFPLTEVSVMDGSKRSAKSNAFFTGFGKNKKIALFDTLIEKHTVTELVAVLAHEIGHFKKKHIIQQIVIGIIQIGVFSFLLGFVLKNEQLMAAFGVETPSVYCSFVFFALLFKPISFLVGIGMSILSRKNEYEADAYAAEVTKEPNALITALKKLSTDNLSNLTPHPLYVFLFHSHPTVMQRIAALRSL